MCRQPEIKTRPSPLPNLLWRCTRLTTPCKVNEASSGPHASHGGPKRKPPLSAEVSIGQKFIVDNQIGGKVYKRVSALEPRWRLMSRAGGRNVGGRHSELYTEGLLVGCLLIKELPKWIITCLRSEVSWHSWILQEPGLSTGQL